MRLRMNPAPISDIAGQVGTSRVFFRQTTIADCQIVWLSPLLPSFLFFATQMASPVFESFHITHHLSETSEWQSLSCSYPNIYTTHNMKDIL